MAQLYTIGNSLNNGDPRKRLKRLYEKDMAEGGYSINPTFDEWLQDRSDYKTKPDPYQGADNIVADNSPTKMQLLDESNPNWFEDMGTPTKGETVLPTGWGKGIDFLKGITPEQIKSYIDYMNNSTFDPTATVTVKEGVLKDIGNVLEKGDNETTTTNLNKFINNNNFDNEMDAIARRNAAIYGAEAALQLPPLQGNYIVSSFPYVTTQAPQSVSMVGPMTAEMNRGLRTAYTIGSRMAGYGPNAANMMPSVQANIADQRLKNQILISTTEGERLNKQSEANTTATNATNTARAAAEMLRLQTQGQYNALAQTEKAKSISNLSQILTNYANMKTDIAKSKEEARLKRYAIAYNSLNPE